MNPQVFGRAARGFTLIELLTVIAIIGILAAILIPTVGAVRRNALKAEVTSNLRQIGIANRLYMQDSRNAVPQVMIGRDANRELDRYIGPSGKDQNNAWLVNPVFTSRYWTQVTESNPALALRAFTLNAVPFNQANPGSTNTPVSTPSSKLLANAGSRIFIFPGVKSAPANPDSEAAAWGTRGNVNFIFTKNKTNNTDDPAQYGVAPVLFFDGSVRANDFRRNRGTF